MLRTISCMILVAWGLGWGTAARAASIDRVTITPAAPRNIDPIRVDVEGVMSSGPVTFLESQFTRSAGELRLDVFLEIGLLDVMTPWSHAESLGRLDAGDYNLTVRALSGDWVVGSEQIRFSVVPEPSGMALLGVVGLLAMGRGRPRRGRDKGL